MCGNISVERSPIFSRLSLRSVTQKGRPEMSITARARAYEVDRGGSNEDEDELVITNVRGERSM